MIDKTIDFNELKYNERYEFVCKKCGRTTSKLGKVLKQSFSLLCKNCSHTKANMKVYGEKIYEGLVDKNTPKTSILKHNRYRFVCESCNKEFSIMGIYLLKKEKMICKGCQLSAKKIFN